MSGNEAGVDAVLSEVLERLLTYDPEHAVAYTAAYNNFTGDYQSLYNHTAFYGETLHDAVVDILSSAA